MGLFIVTVLIGAIVGFFASMRSGVHTRAGLALTIFTGVIGALTAQLIMRAAGFGSAPAAAGWVVAIGGAAMLIAGLRSFRFFRGLVPADR